MAVLGQVVADEVPPVVVVAHDGGNAFVLVAQDAHGKVRALDQVQRALLGLGVEAGDDRAVVSGQVLGEHRAVLLRRGGEVQQLVVVVVAARRIHAAQHAAEQVAVARHADAGDEQPAAEPLARGQAHHQPLACDARHQALADQFVHGLAHGQAATASCMEYCISEGRDRPARAGARRTRYSRRLVRRSA